MLKRQTLHTKILECSKKRAVISRNLQIWKTLYKAYIIPDLEVAISAWDPYLKKLDMKLKEIKDRTKPFGGFHDNICRRLQTA